MASLTGFGSILPWAVGIATAVRNWLGDWRDAAEDAQGKESVYTWPVKFGWQSQPFIHLFGVYGTTVLWWLFMVKPEVWLLIVMFTVETGTYWLTPRPSNKNAAAWLQNKILMHFSRWGG
ncbi:MAG: hypothetical protein M1383_01655 [Patescibacteria group bacterium]|nr:hypothetical protein [Patescibacteria group bacterium]